MSAAPGRPLLDHTAGGDGTLPLVLLHGLGGDRNQMRRYVDEPVRRRCRVLAPDLRGHGTTRLADRAADLTFERLAADVEDLVCDRVPDSPVVLMGVSMGCGVALEIVARRGLPVAGLLLVRPAWRWTPNPPNLAPLVAVGRLLERYDPAEARRRFRAGPEYAAVEAVSTAAADALLTHFDPAGPVRGGRRLTALPADAPRRPAPAGLPPVRTVACGRDPVHPDHLAGALAADLGAAVGEAPPRYDHPGPHRDAVAAELATFLAAL